MKTILVAVLAVACWGQTTPGSTPSAYSAIVKDARTHIKEVDAAKFQRLRQRHPELILIDVREDQEWSEGHAAGSIHISKGLIEHDIEAAVPQKDKYIVLYCHSGARSALAAENLGRMGYTNVYSLEGGLRGYEAAGLPIEK
jgi:rhodanese-related sulfurtransferase